MELSKRLVEYAELAVKVGIRIKKGQDLFITSPIDAKELTRNIVDVAYKEGAKTVHVKWVDDYVSYARYKFAPDASFEEDFPYWEVDEKRELLDRGCAYLSISSPNPDLLKDCDPNRIAGWVKKQREATKDFSKRLMSNESQWLVISAPNEFLATKAFPNETKEKAIELYWDAIFDAVRIGNGSPVELWETHIKELKSKVEWLNNSNFDRLHYFTEDGSTDVVVGLVEGHIWQGAGDETQDGYYFMPNLPTEEVFTMPHRGRVDGKVSSTKPLIYNGNTIDNFTLTFEKGKVVDFTAETGYETLKNLLATDEGSARLGEVALVPDNSPISNSGITYFSTLFDENASCHFAFGRAYSTNIENGTKLSDDEGLEKGVNNSLIHEDYMIGSSKLNITGIKKDGAETPIFVNGNWA